MADQATAPYWAAPALLGALIAALGYLGKLVTDFVLERRTAARSRRSRLAELLAMLRAGDAAFQVQSEIRNRLADLLYARRPNLRGASHGFDRLFSLAYPDMVPDELELHALVRSYTIHTLKPLNDGILGWLRSDQHFRGLSPSARRFRDLANYLPRIETHLLLWRAKYEAWIPSRPDHCLVYLDDEERHGVGFPHGGTEIVAELLHYDLPVAMPINEETAPAA